MIHYNLRCAAGHEFDGWFKDSANFDRQAAGRLIACPSCADTDITRALMAPALVKRGASAPENPAAPVSAPGLARAVAGAVPDAVRGALQKLRAEVEKTCDYVGSDFAEEARRIHNGEAVARGIYGEASEAEQESLIGEGIEFARIPWIARAEG